MNRGSPALAGTARQFFGLSRMSHSVLDIAHPAAGALLALGAFPKPSVTAVGLLAAFAGYTAVFALNDLMDCRVDTEKMAKYRRDSSCFDLDSLGQRHPIAQGCLSWRAALAWVIFWAALSLALAWLLSPVCAALLAAAAALESGYCRLLRLTHWKGLLSGAMVAVGGLAGVWAVTPEPPLDLILLLFLWAFAWEVGGRNIPNDWSDLDEDIHLGIRTVPVRYGRRLSSRISFGLAAVTVAASLAFPLVSPLRPWLAYEAGALAAGLFLLLVPALDWVRSQRTEAALAFFNRACFYPLAVCLLVGLLILL